MFDSRPVAAQVLLLRAALLRGQQSRDAFAAWQTCVDIDSLDHGSVRLLPLLHHNLREQRIALPQPLGALLRGTYRLHWYRNQLLIGGIGAVIERFGDAGIPTLVLKGVPLALCAYPAIATRPMSDVDILIPRRQANEALDVAARIGLIPRGGLPPHVAASRPFLHPRGWEVDLHSSIVHECLELDADDEAWRSAVPFVVGSVRAQTLAPDDHLLHVVAHGRRMSDVSPVRWVADAAMVIGSQGDAFNWERLFEQARARRLTLLIARALRYLNTCIGIDVPGAVLQRFSESRVGVAERFEHRSHLIGAGVVGVSAVRMSDYLRARARDAEYRGMSGALHFARDLWQLPSSWHVPFALYHKTMRRVASTGA
jgi:hypothetical protein